MLFAWLPAIAIISAASDILARCCFGRRRAHILSRSSIRFGVFHRHHIHPRQARHQTYRLRHNHRHTNMRGSRVRVNHLRRGRINRPVGLDWHQVVAPPRALGPHDRGPMASLLLSHRRRAGKRRRPDRQALNPGLGHLRTPRLQGKAL